VEEESDRKAAAAKAARKVAVRPQAAKTEPAPKPEPPQTQEPANAPEHETDPETTAEGDGTQAMTFNNLGEAIQYIAREWNIPVQKESEARRVLKEHGINPTIKKG